MGGRTSVRTLEGITNDFFIGMGRHQGSALSPFLFTLFVDELTKGTQDELPWCLLFADDIVFIDEIREEVNASWSNRDIHQSLEVLEEVDRKRNTYIAVSWKRR